MLDPLKQKPLGAQPLFVWSPQVTEEPNSLRFHRASQRLSRKHLLPSTRGTEGKGGVNRKLQEGPLRSCN